MISRILPGGLLILGACGGGVLYSTSTATPSAGPAEVINCVKGKTRQLGYQLVAFDASDPRIVARKVDNSVNRPDPQFRRIVNSLEAEAEPASNGTTALKVVSHTVAEYSTHRGPTEVEERAGSAVSQDAQAVIRACGQA